MPVSSEQQLTHSVKSLIPLTFLVYTIWVVALNELQCSSKVEEEDIPNVGDPCWKRISVPILVLFAHPRKWSYINQWAKSHNFDPVVLVQCVAWLEEMGLARSFLRNQKVHWVATSIRYKEKHPKLL